MNNLSSLNQYKIMWIMILFDLPTESKKDKKEYQNFRQKLLNDGFNMFQYSIYLRHCASMANAKVHTKRVKSWLPPHGKVSILTITDKQFGMMEMFFGPKKTKNPNVAVQLELF